MRRLLLLAVLAATALVVSGCITANVLPDGRILLVSATGAKLFDPASGTATVTGSPSTPRIAGASATLQDGRVLVTGGLVESSKLSDSAEIWDPATGTFTATGAMTEPRSLHTATTLADGRVLIVGGGEISTTGSQTTPPLATAELFDPATGTFTGTGSMSGGRAMHTATLLNDGRVLIAGGGSATTAASAVAELYDPASGTFTTTGSMNTLRLLFTATKLADGRVLFTGGLGGSPDALAGSSAGSASTSAAEIYDPGSGIFTPTGNLGVGRAAHTATLLGNGRVLIAGGLDEFSLASGGPGASTPPSQSGASAELYDPAAGTFSPTGAMVAPRAFHVAALLPDGRVLLAGGQGELTGATPTDLLTTAEAYDPGPGTFSPVALPTN